MSLNVKKYSTTIPLEIWQGINNWYSVSGSNNFSNFIRPYILLYIDNYSAFNLDQSVIISYNAFYISGSNSINFYLPLDKAKLFDTIADANIRSAAGQVTYFLYLMFYLYKNIPKKEHSIYGMAKYLEHRLK